MISRNFPGIAIIGDVGAHSHRSDECRHAFLPATRTGTSMESACYIILIKRKRNDPKVMVSQLLYHIVRPDGSSPTELIASIKERLSNYPNATKKNVVFATCKYQDISARDHVRIQRASQFAVDFDLSIAIQVICLREM